MKNVSIRDLHDKTGDWIRKASRDGEIAVTYRGKVVAKIVPQAAEAEVPYFSRRRLRPAYRRLQERGRLRSGSNSTTLISEERDDRKT
ncbi:MAG: type II toxin-antitoxin system Phd/YefM family antitoxin [Pedosphaera parvula]|nr:type II toxin-antitoxin system Phd/YefM family antitoxin [Planctomycetota bacterium]MBI3191282.1 type II toxin-antitoxin system Phd/YefM family antitoxin [Pedosphaera parvula]